MAYFDCEREKGQRLYPLARCGTRPGKPRAATGRPGAYHWNDDDGGSASYGGRGRSRSDRRVAGSRLPADRYRTGRGGSRRRAPHRDRHRPARRARSDRRLREFVRHAQHSGVEVAFSGTPPDQIRLVEETLRPIESAAAAPQAAKGLGAELKELPVEAEV